MVFIVCLTAKILPGPATIPHKSPCSELGLQLFFNMTSSLDVMIEPMKVAVGSIVIFESLKSKSTLVIPTSQTSPVPQNEETEILLLWLTICGNDDKSTELLNWLPSNCFGLPRFILIKSVGLNEKQPISDKSKSNITC